MIGILDYGMGNLSSVTNALDYLGIENKVIHKPEEIHDISRLIIPGVGSYAKAMENIRSRGYFQKIKEFGISGKPVLGICLGMQLLSFLGSEPVSVEGLGMIKGEVVILPQNLNVRIPHVGWNGIKLINDHPILEDVKLKADFYFVHSYYFNQIKNENIIATTDYGFDFPSIVCNNNKNVIGIQFHPEKSQKQGLQILENFSKL
jgi:imidazole glycerol-phosphate synthase subunit HisH